MMRIRETVSKLTRRTKKTEKVRTDDKKRNGRFHKLKKNLNIFAKFKKKPSESNEDVEFEEINVEDEQVENGFQVVQIKVEESKEINEPNNTHTAHTVDADFHQDFNKIGDNGSELLLRHNSNEVLNPDRLSKASLVPCVSSRISVISQKSMSNASIISIRKEIQTRTVWTQTELKTADADVETGASIENMAKDECESIVTRSVDQSSYGSFEFGIDDIFSQEPVENPKLAAIRDRIVHRLKFPCLSQCDPEVCVDLLRYPKLPFLISLNRKLSMEEADFNELFIAFRGLDYLLYLIEEIATSGMDEFTDVMKMLLVSECATSLVNSTSGRDFIINHGEHVVSLARGLVT